MSGHSKWAGIKHKKAIVDAKRGATFTRVSREVTIAAKEGGGNPENNFRLRLAIQRAREVNMPNDKIEAAIKRGTGELGGGNLEELRYEGYGPAGVAVLVDAVTDNRNRTSANLRHLFAKYGGNLGEAGSVSWMFERKGELVARLSGQDPDEVSLAAIEAGADDIDVDGETLTVLCEPSSLEAVRKALEATGVAVENAEVLMHPKQTVPVTEDRAAAVLRLIEILEEDDDVQAVHANYDIPSEVMEKIAAGV